MKIKSVLIRVFGTIAILFFSLLVILSILSLRPYPARVTYGVSFSKFHSDELGLDWREVYSALLDDLQVKHFRFSAHWQYVEPSDGNFHFEDLDEQMALAQSHNASVILAIGRRLPGWPECHEPAWLEGSSAAERNEKLLRYIVTVVNHFKDQGSLIYWQVENEPFIPFFAQEQCGKTDPEVLKQEIALVHALDSNHPVLTTDGGEFGTWYDAWKAGDLFGTTMYLYIWSHTFGPIRYPLPPAYFRIKQNVLNIFGGEKHSMLIELGAEPWLLHPIVETEIGLQVQRMSIDKFESILTYARETAFSEQYLWGAEWWYWAKMHGHPEFWERAKRLFLTSQ